MTVSIVDIGKIIARCEPPAWLLRGLESNARYLSTIIDNENRWPSRTVLRSRFSSLAEATQTVLEHLHDPALRHLIRFRRDMPVRPTEDEVGQYLEALVKAATSEADLVRVGHGRDIHAPSTSALSARDICAAIVVVAWRSIRSGEPPHTGDGPQRACAGLWAFAGGATGAKWGESQKGWRRHLEVAKATPHRELIVIDDRFRGPERYSGQIPPLTVR